MRKIKDDKQHILIHSHYLLGSKHECFFGFPAYMALLCRICVCNSALTMLSFSV